jgi:hypothetical protein
VARAFLASQELSSGLNFAKFSEKFRVCREFGGDGCDHHCVASVGVLFEPRQSHFAFVAFKSAETAPSDHRSFGREYRYCTFSGGRRDRLAKNLA